MITKDLDDSLGAIESIVTRRKKVTMITIPLENFSLLISTEKNANSEKIVKKSSKLFDFN
jgi:hypothetical protein